MPVDSSIHFSHLIAVSLGGAAGAACRYALAVGINSVWHAAFPVAILGVNVLGSFLIGVFAALVTFSPSVAAWQPLIAAGFLGGFTTFSTFSLEVLQLIERQAWGLAAAYITLSVAAGIGAAAAGFAWVKGGA